MSHMVAARTGSPSTLWLLPFCFGAACTAVLGDNYSVTVSTQASGGAGGEAGGTGGGGAAATGGSGGTPCSAPFDDCNGLSGDGCEANLTTDGQNCGACDHDCLGGTCLDSRCQAVLLATGSVNDWPRDIAVDNANVFWTNEAAGNVKKVPLSGGAAITVAGSAQNAYGVAVDASRVYWTTRSPSGTGVIGTAPIGGGAPANVVTGQTYPEGIAVDANHIYWTSSGPGKLQRAPKSTYVPQMLPGTYAGASRVALTANDIYFTAYQGGVVVHVAKASWTADTLASSQSGALGVDADAVAVYWANYIGNNVMRYDLTTQALSPLTTATSPRDVVVDATYAYVTASGDNRILRVPKDGSGPAEIIADGQSGARDIAQDAVAVYWANVDGTVWRIAK